MYIYTVKLKEKLIKNGLNLRSRAIQFIM